MNNSLKITTKIKRLFASQNELSLGFLVPTQVLRYQNCFYNFYNVKPAVATKIFTFSEKSYKNYFLKLYKRNW